MKNTQKKERIYKKIALIDDNIAIVDVIKRFLELKGFMTVEAYSGEEGLNMVYKEKPDLILLDVMLPGMSGYEVCEKLKKDTETSSIPIIFLTVRSKVEDIRYGMELGASDFITKPFNLFDLVTRINKLLNK